MVPGWCNFGGLVEHVHQGKAANVSLACANAGCNASATLSLGQADRSELRNCRLSVQVMPTDFGPEKEFIKVNDHLVSLNCQPTSNGRCDEAAASQYYTCVNSLEVQSLLSTQGSLDISAKISAGVNRSSCAYEGNLLYAVPQLTCLVGKPPDANATGFQNGPQSSPVKLDLRQQKPSAKLALAQEHGERGLRGRRDAEERTATPTQTHLLHAPGPGERNSNGMGLQADAGRSLAVPHGAPQRLRKGILFGEAQPAWLVELKSWLWCLFFIVSYFAVGILFYSHVETKSCESQEALASQDYDAETCVESWTSVDSLYFAMVSMSTVGYGDFAPATPLSRTFTLFYIIYGIMVPFSSLASQLATVMDKLEMKFLKCLEGVSRSKNLRGWTKSSEISEDYRPGNAMDGLAAPGTGTRDSKTLLFRNTYLNLPKLTFL
eukprot:s1312_g1.t1